MNAPSVNCGGVATGTSLAMLTKSGLNSNTRSVAPALPPAYRYVRPEAGSQNTIGSIASKPRPPVRSGRPESRNTPPGESPTATPIREGVGFCGPTA